MPTDRPPPLTTDSAFTTSVHRGADSGDDLFALRTLIARLAPRCGLDLADRKAVSRFLHADPGTAAARHRREQLQLRTMMVLLLRLETSSSEDLGRAALLELWRKHDEFVARHRAFGPWHAKTAPEARVLT